MRELLYQFFNWLDALPPVQGFIVMAMIIIGYMVIVLFVYWSIKYTNNRRHNIPTFIDQGFDDLSSRFNKL